MHSHTSYEGIPALAAQLCGAPAALLVLLDQNQQRHRYTFGLPPLEGKGGTRFCSQAVCGKQLYIVENAADDPLFSNDRLLQPPWSIRFYAGMPLYSETGFPLGTLAVLDHVPRRLDSAQARALELLADQVKTALDYDNLRQKLAQLRQEKILADELLQQRTAFLDVVQRLTATGSWQLRLSDRRLDCSAEIYRIFGIAPPPQGENINAFMTMTHPEDREQVLLAAERTLKGRAPLDVSFRVQRADGAQRLLHLRAELPSQATEGLTLSGTIQDVTERRRAEDHLRLLETCMARLNDMVVVIEAAPAAESAPRIIFVNHAYERLTGYSREETIGRSLELLHGPKTEAAQVDLLRHALREQQPVSLEMTNHRKDGKEFRAEIELVPVAGPPNNATHYVIVQRDISERTQRTLELEQTTRSLHLLRRCNEAIVRSEREGELYAAICRLALDEGGYDFAWIGVVRDDRIRSVRPVAYAGELKDTARATELDVRWTSEDEHGRGPTGTAVSQGRPVICSDLWEESSFAPWREWVREEGFRSLIALPLTHRGKVFGVLNLYLRSVRSFSGDEVRLMQELAGDVSFGISHLRSQRRQRKLEEAMLEVATSVSATTGAEFLLQLVRSLANATGADAGYVARLLPGTPDKVRTTAAVVGGKVADNIEYPIRGTPCERLLTEPAVAVYEDALERFPAAPSVAGVGAAVYVGSRLVDAAGAPVGLLYVLFRAPPRQIDFVLAMFRIFAARAASELERQVSDARIRDQASLLDKAQDAIIVCNGDLRVTFWNKSAERLYGWTVAEALGREIRDLLCRETTEFDRAASLVRRDGEWRGELRQSRKDGSWLLVEAHWNQITGGDADVPSILAIHTDITARKAAEEKIQHLAFYDQLTRLPNRASLMERLQHALAACARSRRSGALMLIDLDNFKTLNDTLGHDKGDLLLKHVAERLSASVRQSDTVARLGGDEFVVLLEDLHARPHEAAMQAESTAEKILAALNQPYPLEGYEHVSTPSIGVTVFPGILGGAGADDLLKRADLAMYQAKAAGRNTIRFFDPEMQAAVRHRLGLEADLRNAARSNEFVLYYQAQVDRDGRQTGAEALVRWAQPSRGLVSPSEFIPLAEETGLINKLGAWVMETACILLAQWAKDPRTVHMTMSVNVSARQFRHPEFMQQVFGVLERTGANPGRLKLELTESLLVDDIEATIEKMCALKQRGVGFSLDDFGTGYSSLSYLKRFPLDQLKIDQSFVRDVLVDPNDAAIARTIVALGQSLGLAVIAEGVETEAQRDFLAQHGCNAYQGYLYSEPAPEGKFLEQLGIRRLFVH